MPTNSENLTIYFADIVGSTHLYQSLGDVRAVQVVTAAMDTMARVIAASGGTVLRTIGDEVLATFQSPQQAFECASQTQHQFETDALGVSIGFHFGPAIAHEGDIYGAAVNLAARLVSLARSGEVITSQDTIDVVNAHASAVPSFVPYDSEHLATISPKGIDSPVRVHRVNWSRTQQTRIASEPVHTKSEQSQLAVGVRLIHAGLVMELTQGLASIGRSESCDLFVDNDTASRRHGVIEVRDNKVWFRDNSSNGTFYCQRGMAPIRIMRESVILVGEGQLGVGVLPADDDRAVIDYLSYSP